MINFCNIKFIKSVFNVKDAPKDKKKKIVFVGKSNVGKSSLINALCNNNKIAKVSSKPGKTISLNYFLIDEKIYFIDSPGYGYCSNNNSFSLLMDSFFEKIGKFIKVIFVLDSRRSLSVNDKVFYNNFLLKKNIPFFIVLSKKDKIANKQKNFIINEIKHNFPIVKEKEILFSDIKNKNDINNIKKQIIFFNCGI